MTQPQSPGWYDDPNTSDGRAERFWDGNEWTPRRRPKAPGPRASHPPAAAPTWSTPPVQPAYVPPAPYGAPHSAPPPPPPNTGITATGSRAVGVDAVLGPLVAAAGAALAGSTLMEWGRARVAASDGDTAMSGTASFPGVGHTKFTLAYSDWDSHGKLSADSAINNTNPGLISLACGILIAGCGYVLWKQAQKRQAALAATALGCVSAVVCILHIANVRGAFGDPPEAVAAEFSAGSGLVIALLLSVLSAGLGGFALYTQRKNQI